MSPDLQKPVLVTGASGFVGSHITRALVAQAASSWARRFCKR